MALTGGCFCGEIRYQCASDPLAAYLCHCTDCQRALGGAFASCVLVRADDLRITSGEPRTYSHPGGGGNGNGATERGGSHRIVERVFCPNCGSPLFSRSPGSAERVVIRTGSLDAPGAPAPQLHIWTHSALEWALPDDGMPRLPQGVKA